MKSVQSYAAIGLHRHDRHAEPFRQCGDVDFDLPVAGQIDHVQRDDRRQAQREHLADEEQIPLQVAGVDDGQHDVGRRGVVAAAEQHVDRDHFVRRARREAVRARQVDQLERLPVVLQVAGLLFDRDARIVADPLPHAGERGEERRLARVRIADQGDADRFGRCCSRHDGINSPQSTQRTRRKQNMQCNSQCQIASLDFRNYCLQFSHCSLCDLCVSVVQ